jgi:hypothetical protein
MTLFRKLSGFPAKKKIMRKKSRTRKTSTIHNKKAKQTRFQQGWQTAQTLVTSWNSQSNPPKVYVLDRRIHHGEVGFLAGLAGILKNDPYWTGFGARLALDDIHDSKEWFTFKKRDTLPSLNYL